MRQVVHDDQVTRCPDDDTDDSMNAVDKESLGDSMEEEEEEEQEQEQEQEEEEEEPPPQQQHQPQQSSTPICTPSMTRCLEASRLHGKDPLDRRRSVR